MRLNQIPVHELADFIESEEFNKSDIIPISSLRARSQMKNPRAVPDDIALITALNDEGELVGFIGALPEKLSLHKDIKLAWNSCWYVKDGYGRFAMPLFYKFVAAYDGHVMMRDMTHHTRELLLKTGKFAIKKELSGVKFFIQSILTNVFLKKYPKLGFLKPVFQFSDFLLNNLIKLIQFRKSSDLDFNAIFSKTLDEDHRSFINEHNSKNPFNRSADELNFIHKNPWITDQPSSKEIKEQTKYYFSLLKNEFESTFVQLQKDNNLIAILYLTIIDGELRLPYIFCDDSQYDNVSLFLKGFIKEKNCHSLLTFNKNLIQSFKQYNHFILQRSVDKEFVISKKLEPFIPEEFTFQDGEGDFVFV